MRQNVLQFVVLFLLVSDVLIQLVEFIQFLTVQIFASPKSANNTISMSGGKSTQQTTTRDFSCSVSEFTTSTGSMHVFPNVNSPDSVKKFGALTRVYCEIMSFSRTSETGPVLSQYDSCQSRSKN